MKPIVAFPVSRKEAEQVRAARGFANMQAWSAANRKAAKEHRAQGKAELAAALDREFQKYIQSNR